MSGRLCIFVNNSAELPSYTSSLGLEQHTLAHLTLPSIIATFRFLLLWWKVIRLLSQMAVYPVCAQYRTE